MDPSSSRVGPAARSGRSSCFAESAFVVPVAVAVGIVGTVVAGSAVGRILVPVGAAAWMGTVAGTSAVVLWGAVPAAFGHAGMAARLVLGDTAVVVGVVVVAIAAAVAAAGSLGFVCLLSRKLASAMGSWTSCVTTTALAS